MATPTKYKSAPIADVNGRTPVPTTIEQKAKTKSIIENFIKYLKFKHL